MKNRFILAFFLLFAFADASAFIKLKKVVFIQPAVNASISTEEKNDLNSIKNVLNVSGISYDNLSAGNLNKGSLLHYDIIVLPLASAKEMSEYEANLIKKSVENGSGIFFEGQSAVSKVFGIKHKQQNITVSRIRDQLFSNNVLYWPESHDMLSIDTTQADHNIISVDDSTGLPLMVSGMSGKGKFIYFANMFDPCTDKGYTKYPYLIELFNSFFGPVTLSERRLAEMYFDPGNYDKALNYDSLAVSWRENMIKKIYAAGWYYDDTSVVDYAQLIKSCHENGISVLCWLEPPMVSEKFWDKHPEWREKTATLRDAHVDWRLLINLADSSCMKQVLAETGRMLSDYEWDGVNLAELYFDPIEDGRYEPENFTPMNATVRSEFENRCGFDPFLLFDSTSTHYWDGNDSDWFKYISYRKDLCYRLKTQMLDYLSEIDKKKSDFELMLTAIDVSMTPLLSDYIAEDFNNTLALYRKYPSLTLQIEDPANCWGLTPERYDSLGRYYRKYIEDKQRLVFDCNVVASHEKGFGGFPSEKPSGEEIRQIVYNMSLAGIRPAFYSEDAFYPFDFKNINRVLARDTKITAKPGGILEVNALSTVTIFTGIKNDITFYLDGKPWRAVDGSGGIIVPKGRHLLGSQTKKTHSDYLSIEYISSELEWAKFSDSGCAFCYDEPTTSCYVILNKRPQSIFVDGKQTECNVLQNSCGNYSVKLPSGHHTILF